MLPGIGRATVETPLPRCRSGPSPLQGKRIRPCLGPSRSCLSGKNSTNPCEPVLSPLGSREFQSDDLGKLPGRTDLDLRFVFLFKWKYLVVDEIADAFQNGRNFFGDT